MGADQTEATFDARVRAAVYDHVMQAGSIPDIAQTAIAVAAPPEAILASFQRLAAARILVLQQGSGEILMANPFSAVPTPFLVQVGSRTFYGNCIWDALGIPAMLHHDAVIQASCPDCGMAMSLHIVGGTLEAGEGLAHFAIPAAQWWNDMVFT